MLSGLPSWSLWWPDPDQVLLYSSAFLLSPSLYKRAALRVSAVSLKSHTANVSILRGLGELGQSSSTSTAWGSIKDSIRIYESGTNTQSPIMNVSGLGQRATISHFTALKGALGASHNSQGHPSSFGHGVILSWSCISSSAEQWEYVISLEWNPNCLVISGLIYIHLEPKFWQS